MKQTPFFKKPGFYLAVGIVAALILVALLLNKKPPPPTQVSAKIGWQTAWATQGQLALILQKTNALENGFIQGDFKSFPYGAPLSEAALAGDLDIAFVGDQPAITLLSKSDDWKIIGRLMDFRVGVVVPLESKINKISDLKGKTLGIPFGASTHRVAIQLLKEAGLNPVTDVKIINIDIAEQNDIVRAGGAKSWKGVDAFASWDHHIANYEKEKWAKVIAQDKAIGVIMMREKFRRDNPGVDLRFMAAFKRAYQFYAQHQSLANSWYANEVQNKFDTAILTKVASIEPNLRAATMKDISIDINAGLLEKLQNAADFALQNKLITTSVKIEGCVKEQNRKVDSLLSIWGNDSFKIK